MKGKHLEKTQHSPRLEDHQVSLPVSISHKSEPAIVPCHLSQEGEDKQQHLEVQEKHAVFTFENT